MISVKCQSVLYPVCRVLWCLFLSTGCPIKPVYRDRETSSENHGFLIQCCKFPDMPKISSRHILWLHNIISYPPCMFWPCHISKIMILRKYDIVNVSLYKVVCLSVVVCVCLKINSTDIICSYLFRYNWQKLRGSIFSPAKKNILLLQRSIWTSLSILMLDYCSYNTII